MKRRLIAARDALLIAALSAWIVTGGWPSPGSADAARADGSAPYSARARPTTPGAPYARRADSAGTGRAVAEGLAPLAPRVVLPSGPLMGQFALL